MNLIDRSECYALPAHNCLKIIIIMFVMVDITLMHSLPSEFSMAYLELLKDTRNSNHWWKTCRIILQQQQSKGCKYCSPQHLQSDSIGNTTVGPSQAMKEDGQNEDIGYMQVASIILQQTFKVLVESWHQFKKIIEVQELEKAVQYDDNFASLNGGAIILRKSSKKIHNAQAILEDNPQKYLYSDEKLPLQIIIALKEQIKIERISIKSNEIYSSIVRSFILEGALNQNQQEQQLGESKFWFRILSAQAKNSGQQQHFRTRIKAVKFLRLRIMSKYGDWQYFTMTQLKVYGSGLFTEALVDYQTIKNSSPESTINTTQIQLPNQLSSTYFYQSSPLKDEEDSDMKEDENLLTFLLQKVNKLSRNNQFHVLYMLNVSKRLENVTNLQKEFREHKAQYDKRLDIQQKKKQGREFEQSIKRYNQQYLQQLKGSQKQVCPNRQQQLKQFVIVLVVVSNTITILIFCLIIYCCKYSKHKQAKDSDLDQEQTAQQ